MAPTSASDVVGAFGSPIAAYVLFAFFAACKLLTFAESAGRYYVRALVRKRLRQLLTVLRIRLVLTQLQAALEGRPGGDSYASLRADDGHESASIGEHEGASGEIVGCTFDDLSRQARALDDQLRAVQAEIFADVFGIGGEHLRIAP